MELAVTLVVYVATLALAGFFLGLGFGLGLAVFAKVQERLTRKSY